MDKSIVKNQVKYWEGIEKDLKAQAKTLDIQIKTVQATIKALRSLLGKEEAGSSLRSE